MLLLFGTFLIWAAGDSDDETVFRAFAMLAVVTVAWAQATAVTARLRRDDTRPVRGAHLASLVAAAIAAAMGVFAIWTEPDDENFYRLLGAVVVADVFLVIVQPVLRKTATGAPRGYRLSFTLDSEPPAEAIADARAALERAGVTVEGTDTGR